MFWSSGGVIGVCTAYALQERGVRTTLVERGEICAGASHGNGGWIFPSESTPIPGPGVIRESLPWLIDPESPLYIQPRPSLSLLRWMWQFRAAFSADSFSSRGQESSLRSLVQSVQTRLTAYSVRRRNISDTRCLLLRDGFWFLPRSPCWPGTPSSFVAS